MKNRKRLLQIACLMVVSILAAACSTSQAEPAPGNGGAANNPVAGARLQSTKWTLVAFGAGNGTQVVDGTRSQPQGRGAQGHG